MSPINRKALNVKQNEKINRLTNWYYSLIRRIDKEQLDNWLEIIMCPIFDNAYTLLENSTIQKSTIP